MRVAILIITAGGLSGGYRKYLVKTIPALALHPEVEALLCASPASFNMEEWAGKLPNVEYVDCQPYRIISHFLLGGADKRLKKNLDAFSPDVIFIPGERYIPYRDIPVVNMLQNMEPFVGRLNGDSMSIRLKKLIQYFDVRRATRRSDGIIAVSNFVRDYLTTRWKISCEKIFLVYHGNHSPIRNVDEIAPACIPADWKGRFLFTSGSIRPARGLEDVLCAMEQLYREPEVKGLVIAGEPSPDSARHKRKLELWAEERNLTSRIRWAGYLSEAQLAWCYRHCLVFVMTSRVESFGLIAVEALSHGCIIIAADNPCLPEVLGDAATYYPPGDGRILSDKIREAVQYSEGERHEISLKAQTRASKFSWGETGNNTVEALKKTIGRSRRSVSREQYSNRELNV